VRVSPALVLPYVTTARLVVGGWARSFSVDHVAAKFAFIIEVAICSLVTHELTEGAASIGKGRAFPVLRVEGTVRVSSARRFVRERAAIYGFFGFGVFVPASLDSIPLAVVGGVPLTPVATQSDTSIGVWSAGLFLSVPSARVIVSALTDVLFRQAASLWNVITHDSLLIPDALLRLGAVECSL